MGIHELAGGIGHDNDTGSHLCRARHSAIRWPWGLSQIRSLAKGEKSKRSGSRPQWRRWLSSMSFPSVSTAPARDRDGRVVVVARASGKCVADRPWLLVWCKAQLIGVEQKAALISGSGSRLFR